CASSVRRYAYSSSTRCDSVDAANISPIGVSIGVANTVTGSGMAQDNGQRTRPLTASGEWTPMPLGDRISLMHTSIGRLGTVRTLRTFAIGATGVAVLAATAVAQARFEITVPSSAHATPITGRVYVAISRTNDPRRTPIQEADETDVPLFGDGDRCEH